MELNWYAIYTKPRWEKKVADHLTRLSFEAYCPMNKVVKQWSDRKKMIEEPLFNSYVFVHIPTKQQTPVRQVNGVVNFVYWLGKPAVIREGEINVIKRFLETYENVKVESSTFQIHDRVRILNGPFEELEGTVVGVNNRSVRVFLPSLGFVMAADLNKNHL